MISENDNPVLDKKRNQTTPLTRSDIRDVLMSLGLPGENREDKKRIIREMCEARGDTSNRQGHPIWDTLDDFPEF